MDLGTAPPPKFLISHLIPAPFPFSFHATCSLTLLRLPVYLLVPMFSSDPPAWFHFLCHSAQILSPTTLATPATGTTLSWTFSFLIRLPWKPPSVGHNHLPSHSWGGRTLLDKATQHPFLCPQLILSPAPESLPYNLMLSLPSPPSMPFTAQKFLNENVLWVKPKTQLLSASILIPWSPMSEVMCSVSFSGPSVSCLLPPLYHPWTCHPCLNPCPNYFLPSE